MAPYIRRKFQHSVLLGLLFSILAVGIPMFIYYLPYLISNNDDIEQLSSVEVDMMNTMLIPELITPPDFEEEKQSDEHIFEVVDTVAKKKEINKILQKDTLSSKTEKVDTLKKGSTTGAENVKDDIFYVSVEVMPQYPGGREALDNYLNYELYHSNHRLMIRKKGRVVISFIIDKTGKVTNMNIEESLDPTIDLCVLNAFKRMPLWSPALNNGRPVNLLVKMPININ
jgi:TonB family protein